MNNEIYKLYLKSKDDYFTIIQKDLIGIDNFTTFFKNKEVLIKRLLDGRKCDLSDFEVYVERCDFTSKKEEFLGSDFRDSFKIFNNLEDKMKFLEKIMSLTKQILKNYFSEYLLKNGININDKNFSTDSLSNESYDFAYRIISLVDEVNEKGESSFYGISNINYYLRAFCEKYENFRDLYSYMKAMSLIEDRKDSFTYEEKQEFVEMFYYIKNRFDSFLEKLEEKKAKKSNIEQKLFVEAKKAGKNLVIRERKLRLSEDAKEVAKKIILEENRKKLQQEAQTLGQTFLKVEKKRDLIKEAKEIGKRLSDEYIDDDVILEYTGSPTEEDESFKQYLENYYISSGRCNDNNPESIKNTVNYNEELSLVDAESNSMVKR